jgi:hypothetical protein
VHPKPVSEAYGDQPTPYRKPANARYRPYVCDIMAIATPEACTYSKCERRTPVYYPPPSLRTIATAPRRKGEVNHYCLIVRPHFFRYFFGNVSDLRSQIRVFGHVPGASGHGTPGHGTPSSQCRFHRCSASFCDAPRCTALRYMTVITTWKPVNSAS